LVPCVSALALSCALPNVRVRLQVNVAPNANDNRPIPVDLVFVWDKALAKQLDELTAKAWFDRKPQIRRDDPNGKTFTAREWEWVPGQAVPNIAIEVPAASRRWPQRIFVFANYRAAGPHRVRLMSGAASLELLKDDLRLQSEDADRTTPLTDRKK
jgi:type VI secretion system protein